MAVNKVFRAWLTTPPLASTFLKANLIDPIGMYYQYYYEHHDMLIDQIYDLQVSLVQGQAVIDATQ